MKKPYTIILLLPILTLLIYCGKKSNPQQATAAQVITEPAKPRMYRIELKKSELEFGDTWETKTEVKEMECTSDSIAFQQAMIAYYAIVKTNDLLVSKGIKSMLKPISVNVFNDAGKNLKEVMKPEEMQAIEDRIKGYAAKE